MDMNDFVGPVPSPGDYFIRLLVTGRKLVATPF